MNEEMCIITSLNLYEFSQVNNNEMGILIQRSDDGQLYKDAYEEAQRIIRISDEVRISLERVASSDPEPAATEAAKASWHRQRSIHRRQDSISPRLAPEVRTQNGTTAGPGHRTGLSRSRGQTPHGQGARLGGSLSPSPVLPRVISVAAGSSNARHGLTIACIQTSRRHFWFSNSQVKALCARRRPYPSTAHPGTRQFDCPRPGRRCT